MSETRIEYTIEVTNRDGSVWALSPVGLGDRATAESRLTDLLAIPAEADSEVGQTFRLVRREITVGEWEPVPASACNHAPSDYGTTLVYEGHYGAPGIGYAASCSECGASFSVVGGTAYDPNEGAHIMNAEDCA